MENEERNSFTGLSMTKHDDSQERNLLTGTNQPVKNDATIFKSDSLILWPSISKRDVSESDDEETSEFRKHVPIFVEKADEHIVCGVVYEPDTLDAQGDRASADEIRKAAFDFMENARTFKVNHKGKKADVVILESYVAPDDFSIGKREIKKGSWLITARVNDSEVWKAIKSGELTGFSMAGYVRVD